MRFASTSAPSLFDMTRNWARLRGPLVSLMSRNLVAVGRPVYHFCTLRPARYMRRFRTRTTNSTTRGIKGETHEGNH